MNLGEGITVCNDKTYVLDKIIWSKYDMVETKNRVITLLVNMKENRARGIYAIINCNLNSNIRKTVSIKGNRKGSFSDKVDKLIDQENNEKILNKVKQTFTELELKYYIYCLENNRSEQSFIEIVENISKIGLRPIKYSCILKIALAFNIAVLKNK